MSELPRPGDESPEGDAEDRALDPQSTLPVPATENELGQSTLAEGFSHETAGPKPTQPAGLSGSSHRYHPIRFHARGGLGEIHVASDAELNREVALKELRPQYAADQPSRARFIMEGEVTGRLEHPGVVPVYGMGLPGDGSPFYVMRFIRGESLAEAIKSLYHRSRRDVSGSSQLELHKLLRRFITVCQTIDYAHSRGVLHRDIKPENIMLGPYGETLVVDWGLAKIIGREKASGPRQELETTLNPGHQLDSQATLHGSLAGTLLYMSPEQALGWHDQLAPPSDVFSLGATLFELLTGRTLYVAKTVDQALQLAIQCEPTPARQLNRRIAKPLEAICLKATAREPQQRYQRAGELADDLEAYLADEPVTAHRDNLLEAAGRWARKHRTLVTTATAVGMVALLSLGGLAWMLGENNRRIAAKNIEISEQRDAAERNYQLARAAVDDYLSRLAQDERLTESGLDKLRLELARAAAPYYDQFLAISPDDRQLLFEQARAQADLGHIAYQASSLREAEQHFLKAAQSLEQLVKQYPDERVYQLSAAKIASRLAFLNVAQAENTQGIAGFEAVLAMLKDLAPDDETSTQQAVGQVGEPAEGFLGNLDPLSLRVFCLDGLARAHLESGKVTFAIEQLQSAAGLIENHLATGLSSTTVHLVSPLASLGDARVRLGDSAAAAEHYQRVLDLITGVDVAADRYVDLKTFEVDILTRLGNRAMASGRQLSAVEYYERASALAEDLEQRFPENALVREAVSIVRSNLASPQVFRQDNQDEVDGEDWAEHREDELQAALQLLQDQARENPGMAHVQLNEATGRQNLAQFYLGRQRYRDAEDELEMTLESVETLLQEHPHLWLAKFRQAHGLLLLADAVSRQGDREQAVESIRRAAEICETSYADLGVVDFAQLASEAYWRLAQLAQDDTEIRRMIERRLEIIESWPEALKSEPVYYDLRSKCYEMLSINYFNAGQVSEAAEAHALALEQCQAAIAIAPEEPHYKLRQMTLHLVAGLRQANPLASMQENESAMRHFYATVRATRTIPLKWFTTEMLSTVADAFEVMAANNYEIEDYAAQADDLQRRVDLIEAIYERTANPAELLRKSESELDLSAALYNSGEIDKCRPMIAEARKSAEDYQKLKPRSGKARNLRALSHVRDGEFFFLQGDYAQAAEQYDVAVQFGPTENYNYAKIYRASCFAHLDNYRRAIDDIHFVSAAAGSLDATNYYDMACVLSLCLPVVADDEELTEDEREQLSQNLRSEAVGLLEQCFEQAGESATYYRDLARNDSDLEPLSAWPEFGALFETAAVEAAPAADSQEKDDP